MANTNIYLSLCKRKIKTYSKDRSINFGVSGRIKFRVCEFSTYTSEAFFCVCNFTEIIFLEIACSWIYRWVLYRK